MIKSGLTKYLLFLIILVQFSCSKSNVDPKPGELSSFQKETIEYFKEIALGFEFGSASEITRKWKDDMKIYVSGEKRPNLQDELSSIINEINTLCTDGFQLSITNDSLSSNFLVFFGSGDAYAKIYPAQTNYVGGNFGLFSVYWTSNNLNRGHMYVDIYRADEVAQRHLLREELTQSLGLAKDSSRYPESIFQQDWTYTTQYAEIDKELIRLLYHPEMHSGLDATQVEQVLTQILMEENLQ